MRSILGKGVSELQSADNLIGALKDLLGVRLLLLLLVLVFSPLLPPAFHRLSATSPFPSIASAPYDENASKAERVSE